ncbi:MAG: sodium:solute symporter [Candidatus Hydrogenedentes bacterium]|nr:sodium:solute symporter [Candidatus Hydrogenedentota bacterium]
MELAPSFGLLNYTVLSVYLVAMIAMGIVTAGSQKTTTDYFLAGRRMPWLAVAMSVFATITSAVSYLGVPGLAYSENVSFLVGILMMPVVAPFIITLFLPFYRKLNVTTSYEYIYRRFGTAARYTVSGLFILARLGWLGTVIYAPALALSVVTGMPVWLAILLMGMLATAYTVLGGLAAVIWTDVAQFLVLSVGAVITAVALLTTVPHGFTGIMSVAAESGRLNLLEWRPKLAEMTVAVVAVSYFFNFLHDYGVDQVTVQRLLATNSYAGMARATALNAVFTVAIMSLLAFIGLGLFAYYQAYPGTLPHGVAGDRIFPYYIVHALPAGVSGLVITGIFAAAMSSMDSGINSLSTVVVTDFVRPLRRAATRETSDVRLARLLTLIFGVFATAVAFYAATLGSILAAAQSFLGLFSGPVLALFLLGILTKRGTYYGWLVGIMVAIPLTVWIQLDTNVHFIYYFPLTFLVSLGLGYLVSLPMKPGSNVKELTLQRNDPTQDTV